MPIEIPTVKRLDNTPDAGAPRIDVRTPNGAQDLAQTDTALDTVASQAIKYRNQVADQAADTISTDASNKLEQRWKTEMYGDPENGKIGLKYQQGNPTDLYKQFDTTMQGHMTELSSNDQWDPETQNLVNRRLGKKAEELRMQTLTEYGAQQNHYDDTITKDGVKLNQDALPDATTYIHPGDDSTLAPFQNRLANIRNLNISKALRYGSAQLDPNGDTPYTAPDGTVKAVTLGPAAKLQIAKDTSDGVYDAVDNLIKSGALDKAQVLKDKYGDIIEPLKRNKMEEEFKKQNINQQAFQISGAAQGKTPVQIDNLLKDADPEVRHKALTIISDNGRSEQNIREQQQKENYQQLAQKALAFQRANPAATQTDLENQPFYAHFVDKLNPKDVKAVNEIVAPPKVSDPAAIARVNTILRGDDPNNDPRQMTPQDVNKALAGLSATDRAQYQRRLMGATSQTEGQQFQQNQRAATELKAQAFRLGLVKPNNQSRTDVEKGSNEDQNLGILQDRLTPVLEKMGALKPSELQKTVHDFLIQQQAGKDYSPPARFQAHGPAFDKASTTPPAGKAPGLTAIQIRAKALTDFTKQNSRQPNEKELNDFINNDGSGRYK